MDEFEKKQIELCLTCKVAHDVIRDYGNIYDDLFESSSIKGNKDKKTFEENVNILANRLKIQGNHKQKCYRLKLLSNYEETNSEVPYQENCYTILQQIVTFLKPFYESMYTIPNEKPYAKIIYSKMNELNRKHTKEYNGDAVEKIIDNIYDDKYLSKNIESIKTDLDDMFLEYINANITESRLHCDYKQKAGLSLFKDVVQKVEKDQKEFASLRNKIEGLSSKSQDIIWNYIRYAPKKFGDILSIIMNLQEMNETDVSRLLDIKPNRVQAYLKNVEPPEDEHTVFLLSRALLVSEKVLYCGVGQKFGNWNTLYKKEEIEYLKNCTEVNLTNITEVKDWLKKNIREFMEMEQAEFKKLIEEHTPDFFCMEEISVFPDMETSYEKLLDKKAVNTLLEVLSKLENRENLGD